MNEVASLHNVAQFHKTFQHPILDDPKIPSEERCQLRVSLIQEELMELEAAILDKDMVEIADALCDIQYVLSGAVLEFGLGKKFKKLFEEVQRSNMSKSCKTKEDAKDTVAYYEDVYKMDCYFKEVNGKYLVYRTSDNKTLKSINYSRANLAQILKEED